MHNTKGFTLIELVMVILVLGILAIMAIPKYTNLTANADNAAEAGVLGAVRAGVATSIAANNGTIPATLDAASNGACTAANVCFTTVLTDGISGGGWTRVSATSYTHFAASTNTSTYTYTPLTGSFVCTTNCP